MKTHVQVLGILFLVSAGFLAFLAAALPLGLGIIGAIIGQSADPDAATGIAVMGLVGTGLAIFFGVLAVVWGICGYGVLKHKPWARIFAIILCAMSLVKIPIGTAFGIYGLWVMFNKETEAIFANAPRA
jgi:membrane protease YdiL (CAAX protease family)